MKVGLAATAFESVAVLPVGAAKIDHTYVYGPVPPLSDAVAVTGWPTSAGLGVRLVFDRGFACPAITGYLARRKATFYQRIKAGKKVLGLHHLAKRRIGEFAIKPTDAKLDAKPVARETEFLTDDLPLPLR